MPLPRLAPDERGPVTVEYVIVLSLLATSAIGKTNFV